MACSISFLVDCNLSCKCEECSFICSGENWEMFEKHRKECIYFEVDCSNESCPFNTKRYLMEHHSAECEYAIEICPNGHCSLEMKRREMHSHLQKCPYQMVSCKNKPFGCETITARKDLMEHLKTCSLTPTPCERCGEPKRSSLEHVCQFDIEICPHCNKEFIIKDFDLHQNSCLAKCRVCEEYFPNSEIRHHQCPMRKCGYRFCQFKDLPLIVGQHMSECGYKSVNCYLCQKYVLAKNLKLHTSKCEKRIRCQKCNLNIEISSKNIHDVLDGIAHICQTTNPTCREEVQSGFTNSLQEMNPQDEKHKTDAICCAYDVNNDQQTTNPTCREEVQSGLTNSLQEMNPQDEKHKTDAICSAYNVNNDQQQQKTNGENSEKFSSKENVVTEINFTLAHEMVHNVNDDEMYQNSAGMEFILPSYSSCSKSRNWFRKFLEEIDKHIFLKQEVRNKKYNILNF